MLFDVSSSNNQKTFFELLLPSYHWAGNVLCQSLTLVLLANKHFTFWRWRYLCAIALGHNSLPILLPFIYTHEITSTFHINVYKTQLNHVLQCTTHTNDLHAHFKLMYTHSLYLIDSRVVKSIKRVLIYCFKHEAQRVSF